MSRAILRASRAPHAGQLRLTRKALMARWRRGETDSEIAGAINALDLAIAYLGGEELPAYAKPGFVSMAQHEAQRADDEHEGR